jgi:hypothetical protein
MEYTIEVTDGNTGEVETVDVDAPNQRDAHLLAARWVTGDDIPSGTETRILSPTGGTRIF